MTTKPKPKPVDPAFDSEPGGTSVETVAAKPKPVPRDRRIRMLAVGESEASTTVVALCEDDSMWQLATVAALKASHHWQRLPPIPDDG